MSTAYYYYNLPKDYRAKPVTEEQGLVVICISCARSLRLLIFSICKWPVKQVDNFVTHGLPICFEEFFAKENRTFYLEITSIRLSVRL